eukprot:TCALIF_12455-PA protein Name:"Similar to PLCB4 1-phosphatidylinositol 4,5-bisphosphate phosphodiesterase beta-4 (Homo sapiens)" AED:0.17 eAED:0.17 QI:0/0.75/0.82/0.94/1/1/17/384/960
MFQACDFRGFLKMTKAFKLNWRIPVPKELQDGEMVDRWTEDGDVETCLVQVDECGFFIHWKSENREGDVLELSQVNDIRQGKQPTDPRVMAGLRSKSEVLERSVTVCSGLDMVNITLCHFVFQSKDHARIWRSNLRRLTNNVKMNNVCPKTNLEKHWKRLRMTTTVDGNVSVRAVAKTFASGKTERLVYQVLQECQLPCGKNDSIPMKDFTFEKFYQIYKILCPRTDIDNLFEELVGDKEKEELSVEKLMEFLNERQRDPRLNEILYPHYNAQRAKEIIITHEPEKELVQRDVISKEGLTNYLMSDENAPVFLDRLDIYQDMDQPLPHYYINSSHNTYLTSRQFGGKSSVEMYRQDVILAIRDCAFVTSDYPLILSFENHCCRQQQYKMAKYCDEIFGDLLLKEPLPDFPAEPGMPLPSPNHLKRKILIKNKRLRPEVEKMELDQFLRGELKVEESNEEKEDAHATSAVTCRPLEAGNSVAGSTSTTGSGQPTPGGKGMVLATTSAGGSASVTKAVSEILPTVTATTYQGSTLNVHPLLSSMIFWNSGCQLVSLNFQTPDLPMQLNQGKFEYNGNCGYLLKPDFMRRDDKEFDPFSETPVDGVIAAQCTVTVISGQFLSDKKVGTYVEVDMYGLPTDTIRKEYKTKIVQANGLNPIYEAEKFTFRKVVLPELAVLRFGVYDDNGKMLGQRILPFEDLQAGYRHIALRTEGNFPMSLPMLFCNIELKVYIPEGLNEFMDALSDPRIFLSNQEKRVAQLKHYGIEESDISTDGAIIDGNKISLPGIPVPTKKKPEELDEQKFDAITPDSLKLEKAFRRVLKKNQKDLETLRKAHAKERAAVQKTQCSAIEKLVKSKGKENKGIHSAQARKSVEISRDIQTDKTLKSKAEKQRIIREKNSANTKLFLEERKASAYKQAKRKEKLKQVHIDQQNELQKYLQMSKEMYRNEEIEYQLAAKQESYV